MAPATTSSEHAVNAHAIVLRTWVNAMFGTLVRLQGFVRRGAPLGVALLSMTVLAACGSSGSGATGAASGSGPSGAGSGAAKATPVAVSHLNPAARAEKVIDKAFSTHSRVGNGRLTLKLRISLRGRPRSLSAVSTGATADATGMLRQLGIDPKRWLVDPQIVGSEQVGGVATTHVRAGVDVARLVGDLGKALPQLTGSRSQGQQGMGMTPKLERQIATAISAPAVDLWAASADDTLRKLSLAFDLLPGKLATQTRKTAARAQKAGSGPIPVKLTVGLSDVNQPQRITAPAHARSFGAFKRQLQELVGQLALPGSVATIPAPQPLRAGRNRGGAPELTLSPYARCIANTHGDISKMQGCASLSNR